MNKVILIGNLTKDPELTTTSNGVSLCKFTLAVQRRFSNGDGDRDADFIPIIVWRNNADNCYKYLKKGSRAAVFGTIQTRSYDGQDGTRRYVTEVVADEVEFVGARADNGEGGEKAKPAPAAKKEVVGKFEPIDDDNLPF